MKAYKAHADDSRSCHYDRSEWPGKVTEKYGGEAVRFEKSVRLLDEGLALLQESGIQDRWTEPSSDAEGYGAAARCAR